MSSTNERFPDEPLENMESASLIRESLSVEKVWESRAKGVKSLTRKLADANQIFGDLATIVKGQGETISNLNQNYEQSTMNVDRAHSELVKARSKARYVPVKGVLYVMLGLLAFGILRYIVFLII